MTGELDSANELPRRKQRGIKPRLRNKKGFFPENIRQL
jgi:hypothetical protein